MTTRDVWQLWPRFGPGALLYLRRDACDAVIHTFEAECHTLHMRRITRSELGELPDAHTFTSTPNSPWQHAIYLPHNTSYTQPHSAFTTLLEGMAPLLQDASFFTCHDHRQIEHTSVCDAAVRLTLSCSSTHPSLDLSTHLRTLRQHVQRHPDLHRCAFPVCESCAQRFNMQLPPTLICDECQTWDRIASLPKEALDEVVNHLKCNRRIQAIKTMKNNAPNFVSLGEAMHTTELISSLLKNP